MPPINMVICPHCGEEIDRLHYRASGSRFLEEYGSSRLSPERDYLIDESDGQEEGDSDFSDITYSCPSCDHEFNRRQALLVLRGEPIPDEEVRPVTIRNVDFVTTNTNFEDFLSQRLTAQENPLILRLPQTGFSVFTCPECKDTHLYCTTNNGAILCINCNTVLRPPLQEDIPTPDQSLGESGNRLP